MAHARMLARTGIIQKQEAAEIIKGLLEIKLEIEEGRFPFSIEFEDIHRNIEKRLFEKIGLVAGKLHTAQPERPSGPGPAPSREAEDFQSGLEN